MLAFFCLALDVIVLLFSLYIITIPFKKLRNIKNRGIFGEMYEMTKYKLRSQVAYTFVFVIRRFTFLTIGMFITN